MKTLVCLLAVILVVLQLRELHLYVHKNKQTPFVRVAVLVLIILIIIELVLAVGVFFDKECPVCGETTLSAYYNNPDLYNAFPQAGTASDKPLGWNICGNCGSPKS